MKAMSLCKKLNLVLCETSEELIYGRMTNISMLVVERQREIINRLGKDGSARVTELAKLFNVTEETIRRDLDRLEAEGKLVRSHGGAVCVQENSNPEIPYPLREISHVEEKISIARKAVERVIEGDTILLDASTSAWQMAQLLPDIRLTVVTNAIKVALALAEHTRTHIIVTGGALLPSSLSFVGPVAESFLSEYRVDKLFLSCKGVDFQRGLSESNELQAIMKKRMIGIADVRYLLVDHSKFQVNALTVFGNLENIDEVITDAGVDDSVVNLIKQSGARDVTISE